MDKEIIEQAVNENEEFSCLDNYESLINIVKTNDLDALADYEYDLADDRMSVLNTLIKADIFGTAQLLRIAKVDRFILNNPVPRPLNYLKSWLKRNALIVKDPDEIPVYPDTSPRPIPMYQNPSRGWYTKKQIEFFKRRNEVYLNLWENAKIQDLQVYKKYNHRSLATFRSALQRVVWGNYLSDGQVFRLIRADLKFYLDPDADKIAPEYLELITELLEQYDLRYYFTEQAPYDRSDDKTCEDITHRELDRWDWFTGTFEDEDTRHFETRRSIEARGRLHCYYLSGYLSPHEITELIELDKAALLSPHWDILNSFERNFISEFLLENGVFDPLPVQPQEALKELHDYLKL